MMSMRIRWWWVVILFAVCSIQVRSCEGKSRECTSSSLPSSYCRETLKITYPFRLKGDPDTCGKSNFELSCENNRSTMIELGSWKYQVHEIDYHKTRMRVSDPTIQKDSIYSLPNHSLSSTYFYNNTHGYYYVESSSGVVMFLNCETPVTTNTTKSPKYIKLTASSFSSWSNYVVIGDKLRVSDIEDSCTINLVYPIIINSSSSTNTNLSLRDIHNHLLFGFQLQWSEQSIVPVSDAEYILLYAFLWLVLLIIGRGFLGMTCLVPFLICMFRRRHLSAYDGVEEYLRCHNNLMPVRYSYSDLKKMTNNFKEKLGQGGFGTVYKAKLRSGRLAAVKILDNKTKASGQDFINEVATIGRIRHVNVVQLVGFCASNSRRALVYDLMPNGSLDKFIFPGSGEKETISLSWQTIFEIALGIARGIEYLHRGCDMQILHFDIKPHNILIDENFVPKVSDFGLAKLYPVENSLVTLTAARGTLGYIAPELIYRKIGRVSYKADVYSFGKLLMEMAGRRENLNPNVENSSQIYFPSWIYEQFNREEDVDLGEITSSEEERTIARKMMLVALWCIQMRPEDRPSMRKVVEMLEGDVQHLALPPELLLYPRDSFKREYTENATSSEESSSTPSNNNSSVDSVTLEIEQIP